MTYTPSTTFVAGQPEFGANLNAEVVALAAHADSKAPVSVTEFGVNPGDSTDVMTAIRAASAQLGQSGTARGGVIYLPPGVYQASSLLDLDSLQNITIRGAGSNSANQATRIQWTGAASSGPMIRCRAADGLRLEGLKLTYTNAAYDGHLIQCGSVSNVPTTNLAIRDCWIGGEISRGAASLLNLNGCVGATIENNSLYNAVHLIIGSTSDFSNTINVRGNLFNFAATSSIRNPGEAWVIQGNSFEALNGGAAGALSSAHDTNWPTRGLTLSANWFGDMTTNSGTWVDVYGFGIVIQGNNFDMRTMTSATAISLYNVQGAAVLANVFRAGAAGVALGGTLGQGWIISGNLFDGTTAPYAGSAAIVGFNATGNAGTQGFLEFVESGDFTAPAANGVRIYAKDSGGGKTQLVARFNSGAVQVIATEP